MGPGLVSAQPSKKEIKQNPHSFGAFWVFLAFAHREVCLIPFYLGTFALQTCRCSVPPLSLLPCLANHGIVSNLPFYEFVLVILITNICPPLYKTTITDF